VRLTKLDSLIAANLSEITFEGRSFRVLSTELELLYLVMHGGIHSWRRLKWLVDINTFLINFKIDREKFHAMAAELRASRLVSLANYLLSVYFPAGPTIPWNNEKIRFMKSHTNRRINSADEPENVKMKLNRLRFSFICYPGWRYKLRRIGSATLFYLYQAVTKRRVTTA
jgi:hypothetical protein